MSDLRQRWVEALRSGEYEQAHHQLRDGDALCCLGVLCEVADIGYEPEDPYPPSKVLFEVGIRVRGAEELASRNDGGKYGGVEFIPHSFDEIADVIESWEEDNE